MAQAFAMLRLRLTRYLTTFGKDPLFDDGALSAQAQRWATSINLGVP